jgi:hypothetical protein
MAYDEQTTALAIPEPAALATMLKADGGMSALIERIKNQAQAEAEGVDPTTKKGRESLRSIAYRIAKTKAEIERRAKELTEQQRKEVAAVNAGRNAVAAALDTLRDEIKRPAEDWEAKEEARLAEIKGRLDQLTTGGLDAMAEPEAIEAQIALIWRVTAGHFEDFTAIAQERAAEAVKALQAALPLAVKRKADEAELAQLRAEAEARREAEEKAKREAEEKAAAEAAEREKAEAVRKAQEEAEAKLAAQKEQAERDALLAAEKAEKDKAAAVEAERQRQEREKEAEAQAEAKRKANIEHVRDVRRAAKEALIRAGEGYGITEELAVQIVLAINRGDIPRVTISY